MRIKSIEIVGFKSFVDKVTFTMLPGITAIVGPNGCGKSNVVDALRWAMGEQSARHLRGKTMGDVIFGGTLARKPFGMAEVSVIFSNEDGKAPREYHHFSEIMITRRLFRSGESEYLINKVPCRLRDIHELFLDTGAGTRAYSVIEQGRVEAILESKADDRRILIEEAAGIAKYRSRKREALSKLESTEHNLSRVSDILGELHRQMQSLSRQVKRWERYSSIREETKTLELGLAAGRYRELMAEQQRVDQEKTASRDRELEVTTQIQNLESHIETLRLTLDEKEKQVGEAQERLYGLKSKIQQEESNLSYHGRECEAKEGQHRLTLGEEQKSSAKLETLRTEVAAGESETARLGRMLAEMEALAADKEGTLYRLEEENRMLEEGIEQVKAELVGALSEAAQAKNAVVSTEKEVQNLTRKLEKDTGELEAARQELRECEAKHGEAKGELEHSEKRRSDLNEEINEASRRVQALEGALEEKDTVLAKLKDQLSQASSRLQSLRELEMNYEGYQQGVRSIMLREQSRGESKNGIVGLVSEFIETEPQYELAVESVLGERLQSVIVKSHGEGLEAIEFLKSEASGRGTFIPLSLPERRPHLSPLSLPISFQERVVPLTRVVTAKAEVSRVTECLLGDVLLVDTLDDAFEIWNNHTVEHTLVTMDGEILDPMGIITGGARGSGDPGILQKKREIKELSEHIAQIRAQSEAASEERSQAFIDHSAAFENLNRIKQHLYETDIEALHKERDLEQLEAELNRLRRKIEMLEVEKRESESYLEEASVELNRMVQRREEYLSAQQAEESHLQALQEKARNRKEELHNVRKETLNAQLQLAQLREKADHSVATLERQRNSVSLVEEEHEVLVKRAQEERERIVEFKTLIEQGELELDHCLRESQKLTADLEEERRRAAEMDESLREEGERVKDFRRTLSEIQPELNAMNTRLAEINVTLSHLRQDIRDKYQVEVSDLASDESLEPVAYDGGVEERLEFLRRSLESLGPVNPAAAEEYEELSSRHQFLSEQEADLEQSVANLRKTIDKISRITRQRFAETFHQIDEKFREVFPHLFGGGEARLLLTDEGDPLEAGIEIMAQPPGKKLQTIDLLSGGEKALTTIALLFALFMVKPSPFCLLDEADSALDDVNASRFSQFVKRMTEGSQFVLITHNKLTMEAADTLYGVTMEEPGVSKIVSVRLQ